MIASMIRDFGKKHIEPYKMEWDEAQKFPVEVFRKLGELGLMGILVPAEYGGAGMSYMEYVTAIVELSKIDPSLGLSLAAHNSLCTGHILQFANDSQKKKYLPKLASGQSAFCPHLQESPDLQLRKKIFLSEKYPWRLLLLLKNNSRLNFVLFKATPGEIAKVLMKSCLK